MCPCENWNFLDGNYKVQYFTGRKDESGARHLPINGNRSNISSHGRIRYFFRAKKRRSLDLLPVDTPKKLESLKNSPVI